MLERAQRQAQPGEAGVLDGGIQHTQAQTVRNKRLLAERDPAVRRFLQGKRAALRN